MNLKELKQVLKPLHPASLMEKNFPHSSRVLFRNSFGALSIIFFILSSGVIVAANSKISGLFLISLSIWLFFFLLDAYFYSFYFRVDKTTGRFAFNLADIVFSTSPNDVTGGFLNSKLGKEIVRRCGIDRNSVEDFLLSRKFKISENNFEISSGRSVFKGFIQGIFQSDGEFRNFVLSHHITEGEFIGASVWTALLVRENIERKIWWSRERLLSVRGIGQEWSYGEAYLLSRFGRPLVIPEYSTPGFHAEEARLLELSLLRNRESNAILVGSEGVGKMEVLEELARQIKRGDSRSLSAKKFVVFDLSVFSASVKDGQEFDGEFSALLGQVARAGNIIFIIPNLPALLRFAESIGSDIASTLSPYLASSDLHVVAVSETRDYEQYIEPLADLRQHFETIRVHPADEDTVMSLLERNVKELENNGIVVSYPAVSSAISSAKKYFIGDPLTDTAEDLLIEASLIAQSVGRNIVLKEDVLEAAESKSGVPTGIVRAEEKEKLLNLESLLHTRIICQNEAVKAISDAVRRARSGIGNENRPLGSFLFLGPTGVGKTETAKALAEIFFGQDGRVLRLDMSEYRTEDSLSRLIGDNRGGSPGALSGILREHQFGVLLLDEFEKTSPEVLDLFLQILDEGIFSDVRGELVSARNVVIVATSNAGSDLIFNLVKTGKDPAQNESQIIEELIKRNIFKPELLNRFDGIIVFHPLDDQKLKEVAKLQLKKLVWRLKQKGVDLVIDDKLVSFIAERGKEPQFGARPLNRAIQETVEQAIAQKLISGELKPGGRIEFSPEDLKK